MTDPSSPATPPPGGPTPPAAPRFVQPYPGAPPVPVMDAGPAPVPPGPPAAPAQAHPDTRPRTHGIIALCLAIGGALICGASSAPIGALSAL